MNLKMMMIPMLMLNLNAFAGNEYFVDKSMPTEVQAAHESFLTGNFALMAQNIKAALIAFSGDSAIEKDLLSLYDRAFELRGDDAVPAGWSILNEMSWAAFS